MSVSDGFATSFFREFSTTSKIRRIRAVMCAMRIFARGESAAG